VTTDRAETRAKVALRDLPLLGEVPQIHASRLRGVRRAARAAKGRMAGPLPAKNNPR